MLLQKSEDTAATIQLSSFLHKVWIEADYLHLVPFEMKSTKVQTLGAYCMSCRVLRTMPMRVRGSWPRLAL